MYMYMYMYFHCCKKLLLEFFPKKNCLSANAWSHTPVGCCSHFDCAFKIICDGAMWLLRNSDHFLTLVVHSWSHLVCYMSLSSAIWNAPASDVFWSSPLFVFSGFIGGLWASDSRGPPSHVSSVWIAAAAWWRFSRGVDTWRAGGAYWAKEWVWRYQQDFQWPSGFVGTDVQEGEARLPGFRHGRACASCGRIEESWSQDHCGTEALWGSWQALPFSEHVFPFPETARVLEQGGACAQAACGSHAWYEWFLLQLINASSGKRSWKWGSSVRGCLCRGHSCRDHWGRDRLCRAICIGRDFSPMLEEGAWSQWEWDYAMFVPICVCIFTLVWACPRS